MSGGELSGVDLARVALRAALESARKNGGRTSKAKARTASVARRGGREPMGLGDAIGALVTERAWELPAAGATLRERWAAIAPELAGHVVAVGYDADSGRLTVCPESAAWATKLRLEQADVVAAANESAGRTVVRALRILAPGSVSVPDLEDVAPQSAAAPQGPVKTRESACEGYRRALAAHQEARPASTVDPAIAEAAERQSRAMRELSARAFPEPEAGADEPCPIDTARAQRRRDAEKTRRLALKQAREDRARRSTAVGGEPSGRMTSASELGRSA
ncbi:DciA family protein [Streptomyces sp. MMS24-I31]|uniref:DciA family protein n=1 Tax=Streptomyces sp. MMS24-I31 TaxID=3351563 RepID=UPI003896E1BF